MSGRGSRDVTIASRGSALALAQTGQIADALRDRRYDVDVLEVQTTGDELDEQRIQELGTTGAFVRSLDDHVLAGDADLAVHSMKDMPTESPAELAVAAVPERASAGDVLVTPDGAALEDLPRGATVGTSSLRRRAQLLAERPDLTVAPLRGNVDTRLEKLLAPSLQAEHERRLAAEEGGEAEAGDTRADADPGDGESVRGGIDGADGGGSGDTAGQDADDADEPAFDSTVDEWFQDLSELERRALGREVETPYDAVVLAAAGLERSGLVHAVPTHRLDPTAFLPAPGQGALAVVGTDEDLVERVRSVLDDPRSRLETSVERAVLAGVGGGCVAPIGVYARLKGAVVHVQVRVLGTDGETAVSESRDLPVERPVEAARDLAADLRERGAADLVAAAREERDAGSDGPGDDPRGNGP
ncbi:MAG: hydroxymethylbilane synthase [Halobacteriaceae archaeon]